jgi:hypothetical protein
MPKSESNVRLRCFAEAETIRPTNTTARIQPEFKRVWHLEPSLNDPDPVYAGLKTPQSSSRKTAANRGTSGRLARQRYRSKWQPGAGGMCLHTILLDPKNPQRIFIAIRGRSVSRTRRKNMAAINRRLHSQYIPDPNARSVIAFTASPCTHLDKLFMQRWDVMRSDDAGASWNGVSGNLGSRFQSTFARMVKTIYVVPIKSDSEHYPPSGRLRVYRSRTGGNDGKPNERSPQRNCYVNVLRDAMSVIRLNRAGFISAQLADKLADAGDRWKPIVRDLPAVLSVEAQTFA